MASVADLINLVNLGQEIYGQSKYPEMRPWNVAEETRFKQGGGRYAPDLELRLQAEEAKRAMEIESQRPGAERILGQMRGISAFPGIQGQGMPAVPTTEDQIMQIGQKTGMMPKITVKGRDQAEGVTATFTPETPPPAEKLVKTRAGLPYAFPQQDPLLQRAKRETARMKEKGVAAKANLVSKFLRGEIPPEDKFYGLAKALAGVKTAEKPTSYREYQLAKEGGYKGSYEDWKRMTKEKEPSYQKWEYEAHLAKPPKPPELPRGVVGTRTRKQVLEIVKEYIESGYTLDQLKNTPTFKTWHSENQPLILEYAEALYKWHQQTLKMRGAT